MTAQQQARFDRCLKIAGQVSDWEETALVLLRHGLGPLAAVVLDKDAAPQGVMDSLRWARTRAMLMHKASLGLLGEIDGLFEKAGLSYAVMKGPHLYEDLYRDQFPRPYSDIDILVGPKGVDRALNILGELGYDVEGDPVTRFFMRHGHFHLVLVNREAELPKIELHWSLVDRANLYRIKDDEVLARAVQMTASDVGFRVPCNEDTLIYLAVHVAKHGLLNRVGLHRGQAAEWFCSDASENRLIWLIDIDLLIRKHAESIDWAVVVQRCREWNCLEDVVTTLSAMRVIFPESSADIALDHLGGATGGETLLERVLLTEKGMKMFERSTQMHRKLVFRPARLIFSLELLFPPPARLKSYYGLRSGWALPAFYVVHPFNMLLKQIG